MTKTLTEQERKELGALTKKVSDACLNTYWSDVGTRINSYKKITERIKLGKGVQMKQITIYEFLKKNKDVIKDGYVAMNKNWKWCFYDYLPSIHDEHFGNIFNRVELYRFFNISPFDGDWKDSLIKVEHKEEE